MKSSAVRKTLGELFVFKNGRSFKKEEWRTSGIPIIRIQNLNDRSAPFNYFDGEYSRDILVEQGDLLFSWSGTVGSSFGSHIWDRDPGVLNQHIFKVSMGPSVFSRYAFHALRHITEEIEQSVSGAVGLVHITKERLNKFTIPVPSLPEQQRVVAILDEAFATIATAKANTEKNLTNARALFESYLQAVFTRRGLGWVRSTLGDAYDVRDGTHDSPKYQNAGYPLITSKNLKRGGLTLDDVQFISEKDYLKINARSKVHKGDVLFAMIGTIGNPILVLVDPVFAIKNVALFKVPSGQSGAFLKHYLASGSVIAKMRGDAKGTTQKFVGLGYLRAFPIALPPLCEQLEIVRMLDRLSDEVQRLESTCQQKLATLDALKKSFLHQAFTGQLTGDGADRSVSGAIA